MSENEFELSFYQDQNKGKHKLIPIQKNKNGSDRVVNLLIYKNLYVLIKNLDVVLGDRIRKIERRRCLSSFTSQKVIIRHKQRCDQQEKISFKTSNESRLHWKKYFHRNSVCFRIFADFEADNEIEIFSI